MDDSTRTPHTEPEEQATDQSTGTGWSTPQHGADQSQNAPWSRADHDTGAVPRPNDTRQFVTGGSGETIRAGAAPESRASAHAPVTPSGTVPPSAAGAGTGHTSPFGGVPQYGTTAQNTEPPSKGRRGTAFIAALALGAGLVGGAAGAGIVSALDEDEATTPASSFDNQATEAADLPEGSGVEEVANMVTPSVVSIGIEGPQGAGSGSGVIISSDGQILTNAHVAAAAGENGTLTVTLHDGRDVEAEVVGMDEQTDVAVLQARDVSGLEPAQLGNSDNLAVGSDVVAVGSPLGLDGTVTKGIVSALHRPVNAGESQQASLFEAIQTDASINPGNSGGPLLNAAGEVVGINTAIAAAPGTQGSIGLGFAIPINTASYIGEQIVDGGEVEYARIGISVSDGDGPERQATVEEVQEGGAADEAGLEAGDVVTHIDGRFMSDATSLVAAARAYEPGDEITLTYVRDGEEQTVELTLGTSADDEEADE